MRVLLAVPLAQADWVMVWKSDIGPEFERTRPKMQLLRIERQMPELANGGAKKKRALS
jgi:hypothetical protein